jgi:putative PIN family toxin of toxin-antitoxin system
MMARLPGELTAVVLDTNVVVAALLWDGLPRALLARVAAEPRIAAVVSPVLIAELTRVLQRPQLAKRVRATGRTPEELVSRYREITATVIPRAVAPIVLADSDDDHVLALAVAARASLVITGDRSHLLPIGRHEGIAIVTPRAALEFFDQSW